MGTGLRLAALHGGLLVALAGGGAYGETLDAKLDRLQKALERQAQVTAQQRRQLAAQARELARQQALIERQLRELEAVSRHRLPRRQMETARGAGAGAPAAADDRKSPPRVAGAVNPPASAPRHVAQTGTDRKPVGQAPATAEKPPQIQSIAEIGGVLTPRGHWVLEPAIQYSNSQVNRFTFLGVEILDTFLIGVLEAQDNDRNVLAPSLTARYGLTNRLELEAKIPYIRRDDTLKATIPQATQGDQPTQITRELSGSGIGDVELAAHYQINRGQGGWPYFIGNLRYKSTTGKGPFDVSRNADGNETELATGSGFRAIEPSVTILFPSDPAVFFANLGYDFNLKDNVNKTFSVSGSEPQTVQEVDPGDAFRMSFGMAYAINQAASFTVGYKADFIQSTDTVINGTRLSSSRLKLGAMLLGFGYRLSDHVSANINLELGVTADAPDVTMTLRVPYTL
ncbi:MAG: transporter [Gammaproteobacteria bacterium]